MKAGAAFDLKRRCTFERALLAPPAGHRSSQRFTGLMVEEDDHREATTDTDPVMTAPDRVECDTHVNAERL